jgi:hypothetical protein
MPQAWRVTESEFSLGGGKMFNGYHHSRGKNLMGGKTTEATGSLEISIAFIHFIPVSLVG